MMAFASVLYSADVVVYPRTTGYPYSAPAPKTGQKISYAARDDGWMGTNTGVTLPVTRFTIQTNTNCIRDNLTGLIWARNANQFGLCNWGAAITNCNTLNYGGQTDWRLPNRAELWSLVDSGYANPCLSSGHPFANIAAGLYWSSTTHAGAATYALGVDFNGGQASWILKTTGDGPIVWPVRGP